MQDRSSAAYRARWCQSRRSSTSRVRAVPAVSRRTACERSRSPSSASNVLMSSDCVATRRARISLRRRASETRTVTVRLAAMQSLLCMTIRSWPHTGLAAEGTRATRASHLRTQEQRSVEGLARIADLDPEVPPFVAREQAAQLVPSDLEVVDENHGPSVGAGRHDLPSERAGEQLEAAGAWMSRHVAARQPGADALAHLAPGRLPGPDGKDEAQPGPGAVATLYGLEELPVAIHCESERPNGSGGVQILVDHRPVIVHGSAPYHAREVASPRKASSLGEWPRTCTASGRGGLRDGVDHQDQPAGDPEAVASRIGRSSERNVRETRLKRRDRVVRVLTPPLPGPTFRAAVRDVLDDYRMNRKRSLLDVERHVRLHLGPFFGRRRLAAITTADIRRYVLRRQEEGARNATINRELSVLKRAFTLAIAAGTLASRPHIALLREDNVRRGFFEAEDFEAVRRRLSPDLHDFRRTAVRNLVRAGVPERVAMQMVGWKSRQMLDRYHIVSASDLIEAARKLDAARSREV